MDDLAKKWLPVLEKFTDVPKEQYNDLVVLLNNQYKECLKIKNEEFGNSVILLSNFVVPMIKSIWEKLNKNGITIKPITNLDCPSYGPTKIVYSNISHITPDQLKNPINILTEIIADECVHSIIQSIKPEKIYRPYVMFMPNLSNDISDFNFIDRRKLITIHLVNKSDNTKMMWKEELNKISIEVLDIVIERFAKYQIQISDEQLDELLEAMEPVLEKFAGYPDYRNYN